MTEAEIQALIDQINAQLTLGMTSQETDGLKSTTSLEALRTRRAELLDQLEELQTGTKPARFRPIQL